MKNLLKKVGMLILAVILAAGMGMTTFADETSGVKIQIEGVAEGDWVYAYRLIAYNGTADGYMYNQDFAAYLDSKREAMTKEAFLDNLVNGTDSTELSKLMDDYVAKCNDEVYSLPNQSWWGSAKSESTGSASTVTAGNIDAGYYLLLFATTEPNHRVYLPMTMFVRYDGEDILVNNKRMENGVYKMYAKSTDGPTVEKYVWDSSRKEWKGTASAESGAEVEFSIKVTIPAYSGVKDVKLTLDNVLSNLTYVDNSAELYNYSGNAADKMTGVKVTASNAFEVKDRDDGNGKTISLSYPALCPSNQSRDLVLKYRAVPGGDFTASGNGTGTATLYYQTSHEIEPVIAGDSSVKVYSYGTEIDKVQADGTTRLSGAKFAVYRTYNTGSAEPFSDQISFVKDTGTDDYRPALSAEVSDGSITKYTELDSDVKIKGLSEGNYYLKEAAAPRGYVVPKSGMKITLKGATGADGELDGKLNYDQDGTDTGIEALADADSVLIGEKSVIGNGENVFHVKIKNTKTPLLPSTGGAGTALFTACGAVLMVLGIYVFFFRKKEKNQQ